MESVIAAYLIAWAAVSGYVGWLAVQNGRLARRLDELEKLIDERGDRQSPAKAA
jgi:CcmD family protein